MVPAANLLIVASIYGDGSWLKSLLTNPLFIFIVSWYSFFVIVALVWQELKRNKINSTKQKSKGE